MKAYCTFFICLLIHCCCLAQTFHVSEVDEKRRYADPKVSVAVNDKVIRVNINSKLRAQTYQYTLQLLDQSMQVVKEMPLADGKYVFSPLFYSLKTINDKVFFFYQEDGKKGPGNIMAIEINPETLTYGTPKLLLPVSLTKSFNYGWTRTVVMAFNSSPDQKKSVLLFTTGDESNEIWMSVVDENLERIWEKKEIIENKAGVDVTSVCIDNNGVVFLGYYLYPGKKETVTPNHITIYKPGKEKVDQVINLENGFTKQLVMLPSKNNNSIHIGGLYFESTDNLAGAFHTTVNTDNISLSPIIKTAFPSTTVAQFTKDGWGETSSKKYGLHPRFWLRAMELDNGNFVMNAEARTTIRTERSSYEVSGSILNVHFSQQAVVFSRVPKYRVSAGSRMGDSYTAIPYKDKVIFFYNDEVKNLEKDIYEEPSNSNVYKNVALVAAVAYPDGTVKREIVKDLQSENFMALTSDINCLNPTSLLIPFTKVKALGGSNGEKRWVKIEID